MEDTENECGSTDDEQLDEFWSTPIDWHDKFIHIDNSPTVICPNTPMERIVFLFTMLNVQKIFVVKEGILYGTITKNELLKDKSQRLLINDIEEQLFTHSSQTPTGSFKLEEQRKNAAKNRRKSLFALKRQESSFSFRNANEVDSKV